MAHEGRSVGSEAFEIDERMAQVVNGRYTARMDESFVEFIIGMWLPLHKNPAAPDGEMIRTRSTGTRHNVLTVLSD